METFIKKIYLNKQPDFCWVAILLTSFLCFPCTLLNAESFVPVDIKPLSQHLGNIHLPELPGSNTAVNASPQEIIVKFRSGLSKHVRDALHRRVGAGLVHRMGGTNVYRVQVPAGVSNSAMVNRYINNPHVIYVEISKRSALFTNELKQTKPKTLASIDLFRNQYGNKWVFSIDPRTGLVNKIKGQVSPVFSSSTEQATNQIITQHPELFGDKGNLSMVQSTQSLAGKHVRYQQLHNGVPIRGASAQFHFDKSNRLHAIDASLFSTLTCSTQPSITALQAVDQIKPLLPTAFGRILDSHLAVDAGVEGGRLLWVLRLRSADANTDWEGLVDAGTGEAFAVRNLTVNFDGNGNVFDPNPIRRAEVLTAALPTQGNDTCPTQLNSTGSDLTLLQQSVVLNNLDGLGHLQSTSVKIVNTVADGIPVNDDYSALQSTAFDSPGLQFMYAYNDPKFEEVNAYYHYDKYRQYLANNLAYSIIDDASLIIDAHRGNSFVGAAFTPSFLTTPDLIFLGDKHLIAKDADGINDDSVCRELGESADPLVHELGHLIRYRIEPSRFYTAPSYEEGWADYLMASFTNDPVVGEWVDEGSNAGYRRTLENAFSIRDSQVDSQIFSVDLVAAHFNGQIWGGALWNVRKYITQLFPTDPDAVELADTLIIEGMYAFTSPTPTGLPPTFLEGKDAVLLALNLLQNLSPGDPHYDSRYVLINNTLVRDEFAKKGIDELYPNDPRFNNYPTFPDTFTLHNRGVSGGAVDADIDAPGAWSIQTGRSDVIVGIIDSGLNFYHEDFGYEDINLNGLDPAEDINNNGVLDTGNIWSNTLELNGALGVDDDNNDYVDDFIGWNFSSPQNNNTEEIGSLAGSHGTRVASVVGAIGNNAIGLTGINWNVQLMAIKTSGLTASLTEGIFYGTNNGSLVLNASWGITPWYSWSQGVYDGIQQAADNAVLFITAAGNTGQDDGTGTLLNVDNDVQPIFPQSHVLPNIINVTATDSQDQQSERYGKYSVDLAAPTDAPTADIPLNYYTKMPQTSGAAPHVTGAIALLLAEEKDRIDANDGYRTMTMGEIRYLLLTSVDHLTQLEDLCVSEGRLNVHKLLLNYADTDMDGYADRIERLFGTNPKDSSEFPDLSADADGDGLSNADELAYGSIPNIPAGEDLTQLLYPLFLDATGNLLSSISSQDSDGDGLADGSEIDYSSNGSNPGFITDPVNPDTDGDGLLDNNDPQPSPNLVLPITDTDGDGDGMPDAWEIANGLNPLVDDAIDDPDGDDLNNLQEYQNSTNPFNADTDGDLLGDGDEINTYNTDPNDQDSDDDLWTDGDEVNAGTDPANASDFSYPPLLQFAAGIIECVAGAGTPPDNCTFSTRIVEGSYYAYDSDGNGVAGENGQKVSLAPGHDGGILIGVAQPASGSHAGPPDGTETTGIDAAWDFFSNTGLQLSTIPVTVVDADVNNDGGLTKTLDFTGWAVEWAGGSAVSLGGDPVNYPADTGLATLVCSQKNCPIGSDFVLDYTAHGDPSDSGFFGLHTLHVLHFEGKISNTAALVADGDINLDGVVDTRDVLLARQIVLGIQPYTLEQKLHADVAPLVGGVPASNGVLNAADLLLITRKTLGLVSF